jgi:hypothetical protein
MAASEDDERARESRRILRGIARETEPGGTGFIAGAANDARNHFTAADIDPRDGIEYWGTRIGRALGAIITVGIVVWLVRYLLGGG